MNTNDLFSTNQNTSCMYINRIHILWDYITKLKQLERKTNVQYKLRNVCNELTEYNVESVQSLFAHFSPFDALKSYPVNL